MRVFSRFKRILEEKISWQARWSRAASHSGGPAEGTGPALPL